MRVKAARVLAVLVMLTATHVPTARPALAAPGGFDPTFGSGGMVVGEAAAADDIALQPDGRILVAGTHFAGRGDLSVARFTGTGAPDPGFGQGGRAVLDLGQDELGTAVAHQPDGKILVAGVRSTDHIAQPTTQLVVARFLASGAPDTAFAGTGSYVHEIGRRIGSIVSLALQPDGRIVVGFTLRLDVETRAVVLRLDQSGTLDPTFGNGRPGFDEPYAAVADPVQLVGLGVLADGRIVLAGTATNHPVEGGAVAVRLTRDGEIDPTYGTAGVARSPMADGGWVHGMTVQPDGKVVVTGTATRQQADPRLVTARFTGAGAPDPTFGTGGEAVLRLPDVQATWGEDVAVGPGGSLFVAGRAGDYSSVHPEPLRSSAFVARLGPGGTPDPRYGVGGVALASAAGVPSSWADSVAVQPDGKAVVAGATPTATGHRPALMRLLPAPAGTPVLGWGWNGWGQVGDGTALERRTAVAVPGRVEMVAVAAGAYHNVALAPDGSVWTWGFNRFGQLGDGTALDRHTPVRVPGLSGVVAVSAGAFHSLAAKADGTVWAWGWNGFGQLGDGTTDERRAPVRVTGLDGVAVRSVSGGAFHSLALAGDGSARAWGWNGFGQLGDGTTVERHAPVPVGGLGPAGSVAAGAYHNLALGLDGAVRAWGWNRFGQVGDGTTVDRHRPVVVPALTGVASVAAGSWFHSLVLKRDGSAWAWGWNGYGQVGDGTTVERHSPVPVATASPLVGVSGGGFHSLAVTASGGLLAWGWNVLGQLGDGTGADSHLPVAVRMPAGSAVVTVSAGAYHSLAG